MSVGTALEELTAAQFRVTGVVQGVGFRPFVYKLATRHGLSGWTLNDPQGVVIWAEGPARAVRAFWAELQASPPPLARITGGRCEREVAITRRSFTTFEIRDSGQSGARVTVVPADASICADCLRELRDPGDRRFRYPFINCTNCGPRYSLITGIPYDREQTTMRVFRMCPPCRAEYEDPGDRRYHAQPNACPRCGPRLAVVDGERRPVAAADPVRFIIEALRAGQIVAVKSVGGFHLAVDAHNDAAVMLLRRRKRRDAKPFALMLESVPQARTICHVNEQEARWLQSPERPIVLLKRHGAPMPPSIAPRNPNLGVMLPSAPLHYLLLEDSALPILVMTSGNLSGYPIAYTNEQALDQLVGLADYLLLNDRDIETRIDDSVVRCSEHPALDRPITTFLRRARGYAPYPVSVSAPLRPIVAYGAELKTTVALAHGERVFVSQHIGDLKNGETFRSHQGCASHLARLYDVTPEWTACDMHPAFRATRSALRFNPDTLVLVQHHHAHMAACMAEHGLTGPTIGVALDGAGYGEDGTIWGGEFLVGDYARAARVAHLRRFPLLGGDRAVREPVRVALALILDTFGDVDSALDALPALGRLTPEARHVFSTMFRQRLNSTLTSSMGRLFDGVSSLLDVCSTVEYEAQAAIEMESLLERDFALAEPLPFELTASAGTEEIDYRPAIARLVEHLRTGVARPTLSRMFHSTIVAMIVQICERIREMGGPRQVVLSGGVFLNEFVLINTVVSLRARGFDTYCHEFVPPNDGGISLGQIMVADARIRERNREAQRGDRP